MPLFFSSWDFIKLKNKGYVFNGVLNTAVSYYPTSSDLHNFFSFILLAQPPLNFRFMSKWLFSVCIHCAQILLKIPVLELGRWLPLYWTLATLLFEMYPCNFIFLEISNKKSIRAFRFLPENMGSHFFLKEMVISMGSLYFLYLKIFTIRFINWKALETGNFYYVPLTFLV